MSTLAVHFKYTSSTLSVHFKDTSGTVLGTLPARMQQQHGTLSPFCPACHLYLQPPNAPTFSQLLFWTCMVESLQWQGNFRTHCTCEQEQLTECLCIASLGAWDGCLCMAFLGAYSCAVVWRLHFTQSRACLQLKGLAYSWAVLWPCMCDLGVWDGCLCMAFLGAYSCAVCSSHSLVHACSLRSL